MRNFLAFVGAAVVVFLGLGWYLGWYNVTPEKSNTPGKSSIHVDINKEKIGADVKKGAQNVEDFIDKAKSGDKTDTKDATKDNDKDLLPPPPSGAKLGEAGDAAKQRAKDAVKDLIFDGWGSGGSK
jgi:hypothetical protein